MLKSTTTPYRITTKALLLFATTIVAGMTISCGSGSDAEVRDPESIYRKAMAAYTDEDYLEAQRYFDVIRLQYPASQVADDAQFHLAEMNYRRGEFILAAFNYNMIRRSYPGSEYIKPAMFKAAMAYFELSPPYDRDQDYTKKAIQAFSEFQQFFPTDSLAKESLNRIGTLRDKLAEGEYQTAILYRKMLNKKAAIVYLNTVIDEYPDTKLYRPSLLTKMEILSEMRKWDDLRLHLDKYRKAYPQDAQTPEIVNLQALIPTR